MIQNGNLRKRSNNNNKARRLNVVSDGRSHVGLNAVSDDILDDLIEDLEEPAPPHRPQGRDKAKRANQFAAEQEVKIKHREAMEKKI